MPQRVTACGLGHPRSEPGFLYRALENRFVNVVAAPAANMTAKRRRTFTGARSTTLSGVAFTVGISQ